MGTRGAIALVADGQERVLYNHYDSYPSYLGNRLVAWVKDKVASDGLEEARERVGRMIQIDEGANPTAAELDILDERLKKAGLSDKDALRENVSSGGDWYSQLRGAQGDLDKILAAGFYADASEFPMDSLFCEWAYVIDFDKKVFEVYAGFQTAPHNEGRFVGRGRSRGKYYPVRLVDSFTFDQLPDALDESDYYEDED